MGYLPWPLYGKIVRSPGFRFPAMKTAFLCFLVSVSVTAVGAAHVGQTYGQVIEQNGPPPGQMEAGSIRILRYPRQTLKLKDNVVIEVTAVAPARARDALPQSGGTDKSAPLTQLEIASIRLRRARTEERIRSLVNQPPPSLPRTVRMRVQSTSGAWYPETSAAPDYAQVDVRATQQNNYDGKGYLATATDPGVVYLGDELEFNPVLNYYYVDRTLPKKKLTPAEMEQINALFREIAELDQQLKSPRPSSNAPASTSPASTAEAPPPAQRERRSEG